MELVESLLMVLLLLLFDLSFDILKSSLLIVFLFMQFFYSLVENTLLPNVNGLGTGKLQN
jgi:hypothetical protein